MAPKPVLVLSEDDLASSVPVPVRYPRGLLARIDAAAAAEGRTRSQQLRFWAMQALAGRPA